MLQRESGQILKSLLGNVVASQLRVARKEETVKFGEIIRSRWGNDLLWVKIEVTGDPGRRLN